MTNDTRQIDRLDSIADRLAVLAAALERDEFPALANVASEIVTELRDVNAALAETV